MKQRLTILIVDESLNDADLLASELRMAGFKPEWKRVENELAFLTEIMSLIELSPDSSTRHFSGLQAAQLLLESGVHTPFTRLSVTGEAQALEALTRGAGERLLKSRWRRLRPACSLQAIKSRPDSAAATTPGFCVRPGASRKIRCFGGDESSYLIVINSRNFKEHRTREGRLP